MKRHNTYKLLLIAILTFTLLTACGEGTVAVDESQYEPKIAIEGVLIPNQPVERIYISRNFRVNQNLQQTDIFLPNADVRITDLQNNNVYQLEYDSDKRYFYYPGSDLAIGHEKSYRLDVSATIDGQNLSASSTTTVPKAGMHIVGVNYDSLSYYQRNENGELLFFDLAFERTPGTDFYMISVTALDAAIETFVYDNPYGEITEEDVADDFDDFRYEWDWIQNTPLTAGRTRMEIFWFDLWFYSNYEVVVFAADPNYQDFLRTYDEVQAEDGNFHTPAFHIDGDGIGVFGAATADTVYLKVIE